MQELGDSCLQIAYKIPDLDSLALVLSEARKESALLADEVKETH